MGIYSEDLRVEIVKFIKKWHANVAITTIWNELHCLDIRELATLSCF